MVTQLQVYGQFMGMGFGLDPGQEQPFILWGAAAEMGVIPWISVNPLPGGFIAPPGEGVDPHYKGEKILQVIHLQHQVNDDGTRRVFYTIKNVGVNPIFAYVIYCGWTDAIPNS